MPEQEEKKLKRLNNIISNCEDVLHPLPPPPPPPNPPPPCISPREETATGKRQKINCWKLHFLSAFCLSQFVQQEANQFNYSSVVVVFVWGFFFFLGGGGGGGQLSLSLSLDKEGQNQFHCSKSKSLGQTDSPSELGQRAANPIQPLEV